MTTPDSNDHRKTVRQWLSMPIQWKIPVYQRHYAWDAEEDFGAPQLFWNVVEEQAKERLNSGRPPPPHYFGAILVDDKTKTPEEAINYYDVVDGQQRLTTLSVAMFALIGVAKSHGHAEAIKKDLEEYVFIVPQQKQPKLKPSNFDRDKYNTLLRTAYRTDVPEDWNIRDQYDKSKVIYATDYFYQQFRKFVNKHRQEDTTDSINSLRDALLDGFELVLIKLATTDKAQKVFESMNTTGKLLTTFDIIRNDVFERAADEQDGLDEQLFETDLWQQFEQPFWEDHPGIRGDGITHIEAYIARMLMAKERKYILLNRNSIVKAYKDKYAVIPYRSAVEKEVEDISSYVKVYKYLVGAPASKNPVDDRLKFGYFMLSECKNLDFAPIIFVIATSKVSIEEMNRMMKLLESYVIRRALCGFSDANYNKQAPSICKFLETNPTYDKLHESLTSSDEVTSVFPTDKRVVEGCLNEPIYKSKSKKYLKYIFDCLAHESLDNKDEIRDIKGLTVDHVIPQSWMDTSWKNYLNDRGFGDDVVESKLHTIGNLTPMSKGRNASKSNNPWSGADGAQKSLKECNLKMTSALGKNDEWDIGKVTARSKELAEKIFDIWAYDHNY